MKECKYCKSEINEDAKVCPNCRRSQWNQNDKKLLKKVFKTIGLVFLILFIVIIVLAINSPNVEDKCVNAEFVKLEDVYEIHAKDIIKAEEQYKDKYFKFTGTISHKYKNYIQIQSDYISADVYFNTKYKDEAFNYNIGDTITYCGKIDYSMSIQVKNAMIVK